MLVVWLCGRAVVCSATAGWLEGRDTGGRREDEETSSHPHTPIPHPHHTPIQTPCRLQTHALGTSVTYLDIQLDI